jgi:hypothetical protein
MSHWQTQQIAIVGSRACRRPCRFPSKLNPSKLVTETAAFKFPEGFAACK